MPNASDTSLAQRQAWPRLSRELQEPPAPNRCQRCGVLVADDPELGEGLRMRWIEHDEWDRPTSTVVVLCDACSDRCIKPHPRLYALVPKYKPLPGLMALCVGCRHLQGTRCRHPRAKANGGDGVNVTAAPPAVAFMHGTRGGRRHGWREEIWPSAPSACDAREEHSA